VQLVAAVVFENVFLGHKNQLVDAFPGAKLPGLHGCLLSSPGQ